MCGTRPDHTLKQIVGVQPSQVVIYAFINQLKVRNIVSSLTTPYLDAVTFVSVQNSEDAIGCFELISQSEHELFGIAAVAHVSIHCLVEPIEGFERNLGVGVSLLRLLDLPLVQMHEEPH